MSGICGVIVWRGAPIPPHTIHHMADAAKHRASDGVHTWTSQHAQLAHLAHHVTPEDALERQPLVSYDLVLVTNARIDNRDELIPILREHLTSDHPTDADLILAAHSHWDDGAPAHLIGDYAYALWNATTKTLFAARDPMGMRALYYHATPHWLIFATEIKQILQAPDVPVEIDEKMVARFLVGDYDALDATHYAGVAQLRPGHALTATPDGLHTSRYWDIDPDHCIRYTSLDDYTEHFLDIFKEAVRARTRSIKPIGIMLSGGMDSGSIASTLGWLREHGHDTPPVHTYGWSFDTLPECDEQHISEPNARHYGFGITSVPADENHPLARYPEHGPDRDEPFIGAYQPLIDRTLAQARDDGVGVMLSGDRGDLMMGGWILSYAFLARKGRWSALWHEVREHARLPGATLPGVAARYLAWPLAGQACRAVWARARAALRPRPRRAPAPNVSWLSSALLERTGVSVVPAPRPSSTLAGYARATRHDLVFVPLHMRGMVWSERNNARFGQAFVDPWSDRRLASFVLAIPQQVLDSPGSADKRFVRESMRGIMPEEVRRATSKIVPAPLYHRAMREDAARTITHLLTDPQVAARGYVDGERLRNHYRSIREGGREIAGFWWTLSLEMWLRRHWA